MKCSLGTSNFLEEICSLSCSIVFLYFFALIPEDGFLIFLQFFETLHSNGYIFPFLLFFLLLFMKQAPEIGLGKIRHDLESHFAEEVRHFDWKSSGALDTAVQYCAYGHGHLCNLNMLCIWKLEEQRWVSVGLNLTKLNPGGKVGREPENCNQCGSLGVRTFWC